MPSDRREEPPRPALAGVPRSRMPPKPGRLPVRRPAEAPSGQASSEPTVLLVGTDPNLEPALRLALARHSVYVETTSIAAAVETVIVTAPDLVLLADEAAADGGRALLQKFAASPASSLVPVAVLDQHPALNARIQAFRYGAVAVIARSASIDLIAEQVARLARDIPGRSNEAPGQVGAATLEEFVDTLSQELRSGFLPDASGDGSSQPVRLVLGSGRPLAAFIDDFVHSVQRHVVHAEPLEYELGGPRVGELELAKRAAGLQGLRVALADDDSARADSVAQELRARGATVVVTDLAPSDARFARLRQLDPEVLVGGDQQLEGQGFELLRRMRKDTRLRWASLLVVRWRELWSESLSMPAIGRLESTLSGLADADRSLAALAARGTPFETRLEATGPARLLRALVTSPRSLRVIVSNPRLSVELDISDGLLVGATARGEAGGPKSWAGPSALSALLVLSSGRVRIEPVSQPATTNLLSTIDVALNLADSEASPITPSVPAAPPDSSGSEPRTPVHLGASEPLGGEVERRATLPAPSAATSSPMPAWASGESPTSALRAGRRGVRPRTAAGLVGGASLCGLLLAWGLASSAPRAQVVPSAAAPLSVKARAPSAAAASKAVATARAATAATAAQVTPSRAPALGVDESGNVAPSCESLLGNQRVDVGNFPGAAYEQQKLANKALVLGKLDDAQVAFCKATRWDSRNARTYQDLAQLYLLRRDGAAAAEAARHASELDSESARAQSLLGDGLVRVGDHAGAKKAWLRAAGVPENDSEKVLAFEQQSLHEAELSLQKRDPARAERFFRRAVVLNPGSLAASRGLSLSLSQLGEGDAAARWAQRAIAIAPRDGGARIALGDALLLDNDRLGAERAFHDAKQLSPGDPEAEKRLRRLRAP